MHEIKNLKEKLCRELEEYSQKGRLDMQTLQVIDTIAHTVKNLNKILDEEAKSGFSEGYNYGSNYSSRGSSNYSNGYPDYNYGSVRGNWNAYSGRYPMGNDMMIDRLRSLMNETNDERTRQEFQNFINRMEHM